MTFETTDDGPVTPRAAGDVAALERFLGELHSKLLNYVNRLIPPDLRRLVDPQDVLQDTYFEAFRRLAEFCARDRAAASAWLFTIARNRLVNLVEWHRAAKRGGDRSPLTQAQGGGAGSVVGLLEQLAVYERTPSQSAIAHELAAALQRSIDQLPAEHRRAIRMRYVDRLAVPEIALAMGRSEGAVLMLCNRALKSLRREMRSASLYV